MRESLSTNFESIEVKDYRGLLLDLDNTLYLYEPCHRVALNACYEYYNFDISFEKFELDYRAARTKITNVLYPQGACRSRLFAFMVLAEASNINCGYGLALQLDQIYWSKFISEMTPAPGVMTFLRRCFENNVRTCIVTDMTAHIQIRKILRLGLTQYIQHLVTSEEVGAEKPDPKMFLTAAAKLNLPVECCAMIGDSITKDIDGAELAGMRSYLIALKE